MLRPGRVTCNMCSMNANLTPVETVAQKAHGQLNSLRAAEPCPTGRLPSAGPGTVADLARSAAVSEPTVSSRWLYLTGGRFTGVLAEYLARHLERIRPRVCLLRAPWGADFGRVLDLGKRDIFLLCDVQRYEQSTVNLAAEIKRRGATTLLITDSEQSPASGHGDLVPRQ